MLWIGPFVWNAKLTSWEAPAGAALVLDVRPYSEQGTPETLGLRPWGIFSAKRLGSDYDQLGEPDDKPAARVRSLLALKTTATIEGDTVADWLLHIATHTSKPDGDGLKPLMPYRGQIQLNIGSQRIRKRFNIQDGSSHASRCLDVIRNDFDDIPQAIRGKALGYLKRKHRVQDDDLLLPAHLRGQVKAVKPSTVVTDNFNRGTTATLGSDWTKVQDSWNLVSDQLSKGDNNNFGTLRHNTDLSGSDNYGQLDIVTMSNTSQFSHYGGPACRFQGGADSCYAATLLVDSDLTTGEDSRLWKVVTGTRTSLANTDYTSSLTETWKCEASGSTITSYIDDSQQDQLTDTSITTGLRGGAIGANLQTFGVWLCDNYEGGDNPVAGFPRLIGGKLVNQSVLTSGMMG